MTRFGISCPTEVVFGVGASDTLIARLPKGAKTIAFVVGGKGLAAQPILGGLEKAFANVHVVRCGGEPSVPSVNAALNILRDVQIDVVVACGGGSVMDMGKALAVALSIGRPLPEDFAEIDPNRLAKPGSIPSILIPTTAGTGAEVTGNAVLDVPSQNAKVSLRGRAIFAQLAIVDPDLMRAAPPHVVLNSGLDAVTQVIEAYTSNAATPFSDALTYPAIKPGLQALCDVMEGNSAQAWSDMAWTSLSSGLALANGGLGAAHGLASILGAQFGAPHGGLCGRLLWPVLQRNLARATGATQTRLAYSIDAIADAFPNGFEAWMAAHNLPRLADWGVGQADLADLAVRGQGASSSGKNAVRLETSDFEQILQDAF